MFLSTLSFHFIHGWPCLHFSSILYTLAFIKTSSSVHLKTWTYHLTLFALASLSAPSFNPNMSISSTVFLLSTNCTLHIALTVDFSALLKIATSFRSYHILLPYNIAVLWLICSSNWTYKNKVVCVDSLCWNAWHCSLSCNCNWMQCKCSFRHVF